MKKFLPIDRLHSQRPYDDDVDALIGSIMAEGLKHPIVVTTDYEVVDGLRRIAAVSKLGGTHIPAIVTNDYPTMLEQVKKNVADSPPQTTLDFFTLYEQLKPFGVAWRSRELTRIRAGKPKNSTRDEEVERRLGYRRRFMEVLDIAEWRIAEYQEVLSTADRVRLKSPVHAAAADEVVAAAQAQTMGTTGCRTILYTLEQIGSEGDVLSMMDKWRNRRQARNGQPPLERKPRRAHRRRPQVSTYDRALAQAHDAVATLEGIAMGLPHVDIPEDADPAARKALLLRATEARRHIGHFINRLKGSESP